MVRDRDRVFLKRFHKSKCSQSTGSRGSGIGKSSDGSTVELRDDFSAVASPTHTQRADRGGTQPAERLPYRITEISAVGNGDFNQGERFLAAVKTLVLLPLHRASLASHA